MKGVSWGKNNINYKSLLEIFGAVFEQVFCHFWHSTLKQITLPAKSSTVFRLVLTVLLFVTFLDYRFTGLFRKWYFLISNLKIKVSMFNVKMLWLMMTMGWLSCRNWMCLLLLSSDNVWKVIYCLRLEAKKRVFVNSAGITMQLVILHSSNSDCMWKDVKWDTHIGRNYFFWTFEMQDWHLTVCKSS